MNSDELGYMKFNKERWTLADTGSWGDGCGNQRIKLVETTCNILKKYYDCEFIFKESLEIRPRLDVICNGDVDLPCVCQNRQKICISSYKAYWSQFIYQISHELCHCVTSRKNLPQKIKWFDEFLCCFTSYFVLNKLAEGEFDLSYAYTDYQKVISEYIEEILKVNINKYKNVAEAFIHNRVTFENNENEIKSHDYFYCKYYELLNGNYNGLTFIGKLHNVVTFADETIETFMEKCIKLFNKEEQTAFMLIINMLGLKL